MKIVSDSSPITHHSLQGRANMLKPIFDAWQEQPLDEALHQCRELLEDTDFPSVRRWREAGGKVIGHFQVYFPEEIAHAAGMLPFKVRGAPVEPAQSCS